MTMVTSSEFYNLVSPGKPPGQSNTGHSGFSAAVAHADLFHGGNHLNYKLGHLYFIRVGCPKASAVLESLDDGRLDARVVMAVYCGAPG